MLIKHLSRPALPGLRRDLARRRRRDLEVRRRADGPDSEEVRHGLPTLDALRLDDVRGERRPPTPQTQGAPPRKDALAEARRRLELVHMQEFGDRYPPEARRRHAKARRDRPRSHARSCLRALRRANDVSLDPVSARARGPSSSAELSRHARRHVSIVVSHDLKSIFTIADRIAMLSAARAKNCSMERKTSSRKRRTGIVQQFITGRATGLMEL